MQLAEVAKSHCAHKFHGFLFSARCQCVVEPSIHCHQPGPQVDVSGESVPDDAVPAGPALVLITLSHLTSLLLRSPCRRPRPHSSRTPSRMPSSSGAGTDRCWCSRWASMALPPSAAWRTSETRLLPTFGGRHRRASGSPPSPEGACSRASPPLSSQCATPIPFPRSFYAQQYVFNIAYSAVQQCAPPASVVPPAGVYASNDAAASFYTYSCLPGYSTMGSPASTTLPCGSTASSLTSPPTCVAPTGFLALTLNANTWTLGGDAVWAAANSPNRAPGA